MVATPKTHGGGSPFPDFQLTPPKWGCVGKSMARAREPDGAKGLKHHSLEMQQWVLLIFKIVNA